MKSLMKIGFLFFIASIFLACNNQVEETSYNIKNAEIAVNKMQEIQNKAVNALFREVSLIDDSKLCYSPFFAEYSTIQRSVMSESNFITDEEEDFYAENMSEFDKERILQIAQSYLDEYKEVAKLRVFDENNKPEGLIETDEEVILGDTSFSKLTPESLNQVKELAKAYYTETESSRGAYLSVKISIEDSPIFQAKWPSGKIAYAFDGFPAEYKDIMRECMKDWEEGSGNLVKFMETSSFNWWRNIWWNIGVLRVLKIQKRDIGTAAGKATPGYSLRPYLYISPNTFKYTAKSMKQTFSHELGHVLGLQHEFDRFDRNKFLVIKDGHKWSDFSVSFVGRLFVNPIGSYDYSSIMNYGGFYHMKNSDGSKGREIKRTDIMEISDGDKYSIRMLYR